MKYVFIDIFLRVCCEFMLFCIEIGFMSLFGWRKFGILWNKVKKVS